jgi:hypothetical protein
MRALPLRPRKYSPAETLVAWTSLTFQTVDKQTAAMAAARTRVSGITSADEKAQSTRVMIQSSIPCENGLKTAGGALSTLL